MNLFSCLLFTVACGVSIADAQQVDFARDIQPILNAKCVECHGGVKSAGGFSFVYEDRVINFEADSGEKVVSPGKVTDSEMFRRITSDDEDEVMPPAEAHPALSTTEIGLIRKWIEQGAVWEGHWAFVPPQKPQVPRTSFDSLAVNDIDRLIFRRLEKEQLKPAGIEEPGRLLRRLSFGLTGLPPSIEELTTFESEFAVNPSNSIEDAIDRLIAEPAFGERWATMWLDLVRYADSGGLGADQRRTIWVYRDWVINSLNQDMGFDEFTVRQLAGDQLPGPTTSDLIATACNRNTQTNNEGGTDDEAFRVEAVVDRVNTTWQAWGAITFGCIQCHDHPYDPFRNTEYYQFMDFMNNTADSDLPDDAPRLKVPNDSGKYPQFESLRAEVLNLKQKIWDAGTDLRDLAEWVPAKELVVTSQNATKYTVDQKDEAAEFFVSGTVSTKTGTNISVPYGNFGDQQATAFRLTVLPLDPQTSVHSPEWGFTITNLKAWIVTKDDTREEVKFGWSVPDVPWLPHDPWRKIEPNGKNWGADSRIHYTRQLVLIPESPLSITDGQQLLISISCDKVSGGSHPLVIKRGRLAISPDPRWQTFAAKDSKVQKWAAEASSLQKKLQGIPGTSIPIMADRPHVLTRPTHVFIGGNAMVKGDRMTAGLPKTLTRVAPFDVKSPRRLDMARWWVSDRNPLAARVFVNRVWEQLFGTGIVPTLEDFGSSGDKPTHPELLDHLAVRFQHDHKWSVKKIVREIALSYVYRQSSRITPQLLEADGSNRFLARGPRLRLTAEFVRDQALSVGGLLTRKVGGPPVHPPLPAGVWQPFDGGDKWKTAEVNDSNRYRRSIYTYMKRSIPFPTFATFDAPSREFCTPRRLTSNTPLQALVTLNDAAFVECAERLGRVLESVFTGSIEERLAKGHLLVSGRHAGPRRLQKLVGLYQQLSVPTDDESNLKPVWTVVAQVLLNLDDAMTY